MSLGSGYDGGIVAAFKVEAAATRKGERVKERFGKGDRREESERTKRTGRYGRRASGEEGRKVSERGERRGRRGASLRTGWRRAKRI